eukprot:1682797-Rhodomonas_salina.1
MTSHHAKIEEYCVLGAVAQWLWYQAEYGICPVGVVICLHNGRGILQMMGNDVIDLVFLASIHYTWWQVLWSRSQGWWAGYVFSQPNNVLDGLNTTKSGWDLNQNCVGSSDLDYSKGSNP